MKKLLFLLLFIPIVFAPRINIEDSEYPMMDVCNELQNAGFDFEDSRFEDLGYENLTEFPPEVLDYINTQISSNENASEAISMLDNITFSMEITYNETNCLSGSVLFNDSKIEYVKLEPDSLAGRDDNHITLRIEMINIENLIREWRNIEVSGSINPIEIISLFFRTFWTLISQILLVDIRIQPMSGVMNVMHSITVFTQINLENMISELT